MMYSYRHKVNSRKSSTLRFENWLPEIIKEKIYEIILLGRYLLSHFSRA